MRTKVIYAIYVHDSHHDLTRETRRVRIVGKSISALVRTEDAGASWPPMHRSRGRDDLARRRLNGSDTEDWTVPPDTYAWLSVVSDHWPCHAPSFNARRTVKSPGMYISLDLVAAMCPSTEDDENFGGKMYVHFFTHVDTRRANWRKQTHRENRNQSCTNA